MAAGLFHATGQLARFTLRLIRVPLIVWVISLVAVSLLVVGTFSTLYPSEVERQAITETFRNPAMVAMLGPAYGIDDYNIGAMTGHQMLLFTALAVAIMNVLFVIGATRADEEKGRIELLRSLPVGRLSPLAATLTVMIAANGVLALVTAVGLIALNIETVDVAGSVLYAAVLGVTGLVFAAAGAFIAQLTETSRGALGWAFGWMGAAYLMRAIGDVSSETLSLLSPFGLLLRTQVYVQNFWWPVAITGIISTLLIGAAFFINARRDLEAGIIAAKPGKSHAPKSLGSPLGLAWRLQRSTIIGWAIGMFVLGASYGSVFNDLEDFLASDILQQMLAPVSGVSLTDQFTSTIMAVMSMIATIPAVMMVTKLTREEIAFRTEPLLALPVSRWSLMGSYVTLAVVAATIMPLSAGLGLGSAAAAVMDEPMHMMPIVGAALAYVPAVLAMVGLAVLAVGCIPRATGFTWLYLSYSFFVIYIGELMQLPDWWGRLSPFGYIPRLPVETMRLSPVVGVLVLSLVVIGLGMAGYRRRDVHG